MDAAHEERSVAISSNLNVASFYELMPQTLATATVDRLLHHAHVCRTSGTPIRITQALDGKEVTQLNLQPTMACPPSPQWADFWQSPGSLTGHQPPDYLPTHGEKLMVSDPAYSGKRWQAEGTSPVCTPNDQAP